MFETLAGVVEYLADLANADGRRIGSLEMAVCGLGDEFRQGCLACSRRAIKNDAGEPIRLEHPAEELSRSQEMLLSRKFLERPRAHPHRQRFRRIAVGFFASVPETWHGEIVAEESRQEGGGGMRKTVAEC